MLNKMGGRYNTGNYKYSLLLSCCFIAFPDSGSVNVPQKMTIEPHVQHKENVSNFNRKRWQSCSKTEII